MTWMENPRHTVPASYFDFVRMWFRCRAGMGGLAHFPDAGGAAAQSAWVMAAFAILEAADADLQKRGGH